MLKELRLILPIALGLTCLFLLVALEATSRTIFFVLFWTGSGCFWGFLLNLLAGALYWIFAHKKPLIFLRTGAIVVLFSLLTFLYYPLGEMVWRHRLAVAETYPPKFDAPLEAYKKAQGHYPETLDQLGGNTTLPTDLSYEKYADQDGYFFAYPDFQAPFNWFEDTWYLYESSTRQWRYMKEDD